MMYCTQKTLNYGPNKLNSINVIFFESLATPLTVSDFNRGSEDVVFLCRRNKGIFNVLVLCREIWLQYIKIWLNFLAQIQGF